MAVVAQCLANWEAQMWVQNPRSPLGLGERQADIISQGSSKSGQDWCWNAHVPQTRR